MKNCCKENISFYYYGQDHLILNIYKYIKSKIEENNYVFLYCDSDMSNMININLNANEQEMVGDIKLDNIIINSSGSSHEATSYEAAMKDIKDKLEKEGFWGGVIVLEATFLIKSIGEINFLEFLKELSDISKANNLSIITCYDFSDYINRGKTINEEVIKASYLNHEYRLYGNKVLEAENFNNYLNLA